LNATDAFKYTVVEKKGLKMALVSVMVSPTLTIGTAAGENTPGVAWVRGSNVRAPDGKTMLMPWDTDLRTMEEAIKAAKAAADVVAVSMHIHWGGLEEIDAGKQLVARTAIDAGADMILGHGPHVVNGLEFYKSKPIFYSVGNFAFQFPPGAYTYFPNSLSTVVRLQGQAPLYEATLARIILTTRGELRHIEFLPIALTPEGDPYLVTGEKADRVLNKVSSLSQALGTTVKRDAWYAVAEVAKK
jgi:poly-gamma-glutamate capsule biosynthesis protein CapA/YwtB (metallophosphatase superfamily)